MVKLVKTVENVCSHDWESYLIHSVFQPNPVTTIEVEANMATWKCSDCELLNSLHRSCCQACFNNKPEPTFKDLILLTNDILNEFITYLPTADLISFHKAQMRPHINLSLIQRHIEKENNDKCSVQFNYNAKSMIELKKKLFEQINPVSDECQFEAIDYFKFEEQQNYNRGRSKYNDNSIHGLLIFVQCSYERFVNHWEENWYHYNINRNEIDSFISLYAPSNIDIDNAKMQVFIGFARQSVNILYDSGCTNSIRHSKICCCIVFDNDFLRTLYVMCSEKKSGFDHY